ncbi:MAG: aminodeoxychorismate/anthranilate synthase component II [Sphingobacteriia bacterium]|nr:aminodeoxychorismate/anthranilate synthase component II [Sphingobacteriia bacterium]
MKLLLVDNYDSFTYNLVNILRKCNHLSIDVKQSRDVQLEKVKDFDKLLFSPGPDVPHENDIMAQIIAAYQNQKSILGICLGFQAIGMYYGAKLKNLNTVYHGIIVTISPCVPDESLFIGIGSPFSAGLYHSWGIAEEAFPAILRITAKSADGRIMALAHRNFDVRGVQFHPESVMTPDGSKMLNNWLKT